MRILPTTSPSHVPHQALCPHLRCATSSCAPHVPCRDVAPELERLKVKAVARCRDFLMDRIYDMRRPKTNLPVLGRRMS